MTRKKDHGPTKSEILAQLVLHQQLLALAVCFRIDRYTEVHARQPPEGEANYWWAVVRHGEVLSHEGKWVTEPRGENRTEEFKRNFYHPDVAAAVEAYGAFAGAKANGIETAIAEVVAAGEQATVEAIVAASAAGEQGLAQAITAAVSEQGLADTLAAAVVEQGAPA